MNKRKQVVHVSDDDVLALVNDVLSYRSMSLDEFVTQGETDALEDDELRDVWLAVGDALPHAVR